MRKIVATKKAPAAIGPYAQANIYGNLVFTSGQIPLVPETGVMVEGGIEEPGSGLDKIIKTTCFLKDMGDFAVVNEIYGGYFDGDYPSRSAIEVARLPKDALIEIEVIAYI